MSPGSVSNRRFVCRRKSRCGWVDLICCLSGAAESSEQVTVPKPTMERKTALGRTCAPVGQPQRQLKGQELSLFFFTLPCVLSFTNF